MPNVGDGAVVRASSEGRQTRGPAPPPHLPTVRPWGPSLSPRVPICEVGVMSLDGRER